MTWTWLTAKKWAIIDLRSTLIDLLWSIRKEAVSAIQREMALWQIAWPVGPNARENSSELAVSPSGTHADVVSPSLKYEISRRIEWNLIQTRECAYLCLLASQIRQFAFTSAWISKLKKFQFARHRIERVPVRRLTGSKNVSLRFW